MMRFLLLLFVIPFVAAGQESSRYCAHHKQARAAMQARLRQTPGGLEKYDVHFYSLDISADNLSSYIEANVLMGLSASAWHRPARN